MLTIDVVANTSRWRAWHPAEKVLPGLALLVVNLVMAPWPTAVITLALTTAAATLGAGQSPRRWLRALSWPVGFVLTGAIGIALVGGDGPGPVPVTMTASSIQAGASTLARSVAGVSIMILIGSTTPMIDLIALLRAARVPTVMTDLMASMYRLIFDLLGLARRLRMTQADRLGHDGFWRSLRSTALLTTAVLRRSIHRARRLQIGLDARAYEGELPVLSATGPVFLPRLAAGLALVVAVALASAAPIWTPR